MEAALTHEQRFFENLSDFLFLLSEIIERGYEKGKIKVNPAIIEIVQKIISDVDRKKLIENFIKRCIISDKQGNKFCLWEFIAQRNNELCSKYIDNVFAEIPLQDMSVFGEIFKANWVEEEDRKAIWEYLDSLVRICLKYIGDNNIEFPGDWYEKFKKLFLS
jgi:hypothetical protein